MTSKNTFPHRRGLAFKKVSPQGITRRWLFNNLGVFLLTLMIIEVVLIAAIHNYYYGAARQYVVSRMNSVVSILSRYSQDSSKNFSSEIRSVIESFSDKDKMELMAIDSKGRVVITSSGFSPQSSVEMPDLEEALSYNTAGTMTGRNSNGEKILAVSYPISSYNPEYSAVRIVVSMTEIDKQIYGLLAAVTAVTITVLLLMCFTGFYFIGTIIKPVKQIGSAAAKYAHGDFSFRLQNDNKDEIGELCRSINRMADELSKTEAMKNEFISSVSHELRTPLTAIQGWAETISLDSDPVTMKKGISIITGETRRLSQMVEDLLDFSKMQGGRFTLSRANTDILAELGDAVLMYAQKSRSDGIKISYDEPVMLPFIYGDKNRIRQVFINIIDNAVKYSRENGTVTVTASAENDFVVISVADNGYGIKASDLPKVKQKFYKANNKKHGSGIGLAVADEIITLHGGTLEIESTEDVGTKVTIRLPSVGNTAAE